MERGGEEGEVADCGVCVLVIVGGSHGKAIGACVEEVLILSLKRCTRLGIFEEAVKTSKKVGTYQGPKPARHTPS